MSDTGDPTLEGAGSKLSVVRPRRPDEETNEMTLTLRVGYKTILLIFVVFDVLHQTLLEVINLQVLQNFLGI